MNTNDQQESILRFFLDAIRHSLGVHLKQVILFGSRARGEARADSDYDLLVVVDRVDRRVSDGIDAIAGKILLDFGAVLSVFPISEEDRAHRKYSPLLLNISKEGIAI